MRACRDSAHQHDIDCAGVSGKCKCVCVYDCVYFISMIFFFYIGIKNEEKNLKRYIDIYVYNMIID